MDPAQREGYHPCFGRTKVKFSSAVPVRFGINNRIKYFRAMQSGRAPIKVSFFLSCIFMMLTLAWLTVSLPVVYASQQTTALNKADKEIPSGGKEKDADNPFANTTEEKTPNNINSISEEYLHDTHASEYYPAGPAIEYKVEHVPVYIAFHGELISPPPDVC
jgi:hypothetical protein